MEEYIEDPSFYSSSKQPELSQSKTPNKSLLLRGNFILRQELKSFTPECNAKCGIIFNFALMIAFISIGIPILVSSNQSEEYKFDYTNCFTFDLNKTLKAPIFVYYELDNFYLNHKNIVRSKIWAQLRGEINQDSSNNTRCEGARYMWEMFFNDSSRYKTYTGNELTGEEFANPCGLIAKSMFNDTYNIIDTNEKFQIHINETGIANPYKKNNYHKRLNDSEYIQWMDVEDEHFINWMEMETFSSFRKLWGRIDTDLVMNNYTILVEDNYDASYYQTNKSLVIATTSRLGSASFYGYLLIVSACYCFFVICILFILLKTTSEKKFDYSSIKWN